MVYNMVKIKSSYKISLSALPITETIPNTSQYIEIVNYFY